MKATAQKAKRELFFSVALLSFSPQNKWAGKKKNKKCFGERLGDSPKTKLFRYMHKMIVMVSEKYPSHFAKNFFFEFSVSEFGFITEVDDGRPKE